MVQVTSLADLAILDLEVNVSFPDLLRHVKSDQLGTTCDALFHLSTFTIIKAHSE